MSVLPWGRIGSWPHLEHTGASAIHIHGFMECFVCVSGRLLVSVVKTHVLSSFYPFLDDKKVGSIKSGSFWLFFRVCWMLNHDYGNHSLSKKQFSTTDKNVTTQIPYSNKIEPRDSTLQNITSKVATQSDFGDIMLMAIFRCRLHKWSAIFQVLGYIRFFVTNISQYHARCRR